MRVQRCGFLLAFLVAFLGVVLEADADPTAAQQVFERVFGDAVKLDPAMIAKVLAGKPGERHYVDRNGDGKPEEVWFIDMAKRHPEAWRPLLVRVIDEDGDLEPGQEPDLDNDLYVADWKADGVVDAVCDYTDRDGDKDVDEMALYAPGDAASGTEGRLTVWWGDDVGDDNLLWYDIGYAYRQRECQYRSHFGGGELFSAFSIGLDDPAWVAHWENPFLFYDRDRDGVTEEAIRISGRNESVANLRYSFDADEDATPENPRDFDVSVSAYAPEGLTFDARLSDRRILRGIPTGPFLAYHAAPDFCRETRWAKLMLCWDEDDRNFDGDTLRDGRFADTQERWEGVIAKGNEFFPQIGGPSCGAFNKRYEVATVPKGPMRLYYSPTDQRLHLFGADHMWLIVDLGCDHQPDLRYDYLDSNGDGYIDTWRVDTDLDGQPNDTWTSGDAPVIDVNYIWPEVKAVMTSVLASVPGQVLALADRLEQALDKVGNGTSGKASFNPPPSSSRLPADFRSPPSKERDRYEGDVRKDRLIAALKSSHDHPEFWKVFEILRAKGDLLGMRELVEKTFTLTAPLTDGERGHTFPQGVPANRGDPSRPLVAWAQDWAPPNIGWESEVCGYRAYWGQFDFFGKKKPCLIMPTLGQGSPNYHEEQDWGMDVFHVGKTCGLGGVTLYVNSQPYPVWSPEGQGEIVWSKRLERIDTEDVRGETADHKVTVVLTAEKVGPTENPYTVTFRCSALAERRDSPIEVTVTGGKPGDILEMGIGITKLPQEAFALDGNAGLMASWGIQDPAISWIGLGVIYPTKQFVRFADLSDQHQVVVKSARDLPVRYHIQGDWLNGRRFPRCPTLDNWLDDLRRTARTVARQ